MRVAGIANDYLLVPYKEVLSALSKGCKLIRVLENKSAPSKHGFFSPNTKPAEPDIREAAIAGYTVGVNLSRREIPLKHKSTSYEPVKICIAVYDIEACYTHGQSSNVMGDIIVMSVVCDCGYTASFGRQEVDNVLGTMSIKAFKSSKDIVRAFLDAMVEHRPTILAAHNGYAFDNMVLAYHCPQEDYYESLLKSVDVKSAYTNSLMMALDIPGVCNLDTLHFIRLSLSHQFQSYSLRNIALDLNLAPKSSSHSPFRLNLSDLQYLSMLEYNINDCTVLLSIMNRLNIVENIFTLCKVSSGCFEDAAKYSTGTIAWSASVVYGLKSNIKVVWPSQLMERAPLAGGTVLCPDSGIYYNVGMLDYASLYPNVMIGLNVSTESLSITMANGGAANFKEMSLSWPDQSSNSEFRCTLMAGDLKIVYAEQEGFLTLACKHFLQSRKDAIEKSEKWVFKVLANSLYGALTFSKSSSYSPSLASTVTAGGRWALAVMCAVATGICGYKIVYGDTDSIFFVDPRFDSTTATKEESVAHCVAIETTVSKILSNVLLFTPMKNLKTNGGASISKLVVLGRKMYVYEDHNQKREVKGLSSIRRGGCKLFNNVQQEILDLVFSSELLPLGHNRYDQFEKLASKVYRKWDIALNKILTNKITLNEASVQRSNKGKVSIVVRVQSQKGITGRKEIRRESATEFQSCVDVGIKVDEKFYKEGLEATVLNIMKCAKVKSKQDLLKLAKWT